MITATAKVRINSIREGIDKRGKTFVAVNGMTSKTWLSVYFYGEGQDWIINYKKGDVIKVTGHLTARAMINQKEINKQFVALSIFASEYELDSASDLMEDVNKAGKILKRKEPVQKPQEEIIDESDVPF